MAELKINKAAEDEIMTLIFHRIRKHGQVVITQYIEKNGEVLVQIFDKGGRKKEDTKANAQMIGDWGFRLIIEGTPKQVIGFLKKNQNNAKI